MKAKIKVKAFVPECMPSVISKGDWVDLKARETVEFHCPTAETMKKHNGEKYRLLNFDRKLIPLGVAMKLPDGYEAVVVARSSTFRGWGIVQTNCLGVIDNTYCGNNDEWKMSVIAFNNATVHNGDRVCQFRIQLSQKATWWQRVKWLFTSGIEFIEVDELDDEDRGGFGSTGKQ